MALRPGVKRLVAFAALALALDQGTKAWALSILIEGVRRPLLGDALGLQLLFNPGATFGIAGSATWLLTVIAVLAIGAIAKISRRLASQEWALAFGLLLGGTIGNLVDRLVREPGPGRGHVVDFIAYGRFFVGNVADIAIVVAAIFLVGLSILGLRLDGTRS
jgi:signal peptidase II